MRSMESARFKDGPTNRDERSLVMLVLSRKRDEKIIIGEGLDRVAVTVVEIRGDKVRLGVDARRDILVDREEVRRARERVEASYMERNGYDGDAEKLGGHGERNDESPSREARLPDREVDEGADRS